MDAQCTPCSLEEVKRCGYCANKCDRCFKPVPKMAIQLEGPEDSELDFKFCSTNCYKLSTEPPPSNCYYLVNANGKLVDIGDKKHSYPTPGDFSCCCAPIAQSHRSLLHIYCLSTNWAGYLKQDEIALCIGRFEQSHEQLYVVYHGHSLTGQFCLEFFVSDDLCPSDPLPYLQNEDVAEEIQDLKDNELIQPHLLHVIALISSISGCDICLTTSSLSTDLPLALESIFPPQDQEDMNEVQKDSIEPMNSDHGEDITGFEIFNQNN